MSDKNTDNGFSGNFEFLINELSEEVRRQQKTTTDLVSAVNSSTQKTDNLKNDIEQIVNERFKELQKQMEHNLDNLKNNNQQTSTDSLKEILKKGLIDVKLMLSSFPKGVTKKFQILLFPEQDAKLFYKIVFGRWFMWLVIIVFLNFLYNWAIHQSDNNKQLMQDALKSNREIKAWDYMYKASKKEVRKLMDSAWIKSADN